MRHTQLPVVCGLLAALAAPSAAQVKSALSKADAETSESWTRIAAVRELPNGKVIVVDPNDKVVSMVDLVAGSVTKIGREGNGPGEYALPLNLIALPDGSTLVQDLLNSRFLIIGADGKPGNFLEMPRPPATSTGGGNGPRIIGGGLRQARGSDDKGRIYFAGSPFTADGGSADSIAIMRWDRVSPKFDTVGYVKQPPNSASQTQNGGNFSVRIGNNKRWTPTETWSVAGDGSIARAIPAPYQIVWLNGKSVIKGAVIPYTPLKVTEQDKKDVIEAQKKGGGGQRIVIGGPPGGGGGGGGGPANFTPPPPEFNDTKPPFDGAGGNSVLGTPDGEVWVLRTRTAEDKIPTYDVFDKTGALVKKVSLNPGSRVVGFGKGTVYVVRTDEDDLQYLQRFKKP